MLFTPIFAMHSECSNKTGAEWHQEQRNAINIASIENLEKHDF